MPHGPLLGLGALTATIAAAEQPPRSASALLYDRLGGLKGISVVVNDFIDRLVQNEALNRNPAIDAGRKTSPAPYLKFQVTQLVCQATGGPCTYTGKDMRASHAHLNISETDWDAMASDFKKSLDKYQVPAAEQNELFEIVGQTKSDIVTQRPARTTASSPEIPARAR